MKKQFLALLLGACLCLQVSAQHQTGTCEPASAEAFLDVGNVRARILNNGSLFQGREGLNYQVPLSIEANSLYSASLWVSGFVDDELRMAASRYGPFEFWPGPLDDDGNPPADCSIYDHIWEIRTTDLDSFATHGIATENLKNWPWHLGAPVVDGDGIPGNYNLAGGDLPKMLSDQHLWWIMNDRGNTHASSNSKPIGLEVHVSAFAFAVPETPAGIPTESFFTGNELPQYTFYHYKVINKSKQPLTDAYLSMFADVDIGNPTDDYAGSDSLLHLGYTYNADADDNLCGRGVPPPALGFTLFSDKLAENDGVDNNFDGTIDETGEQLGVSSVIANVTPYTPEMYRNIMVGTWEDGRPILKGGQGREGFGFPDDLPRQSTKFIFSTNPVQRGFWSEVNNDMRGNKNRASDRTIVTSMGSFDFAPGEEINFRMAIVWSQSVTNLRSASLLLRETAQVRTQSDSLFGLIESIADANTDNLESKDIPVVHQNFPNPFAAHTTLQYSLPQDMQVKLAVFDMLGREVALLINQQQSAGTHTAAFDATNLPAGLYLAQFQFDDIKITKRLTLIQ